MFQTRRGDELFARTNTGSTSVLKWSCHMLRVKHCMYWSVLALEVYKLLQINLFTYLSFMDKCVFLLLDSIFLSETEGYTFCTCPLTVPRKPLWLQLWSTLHVWRNWYLSNSSYCFGVYSFVTRSDSSEIYGIINVLTMEFVAFKKDTTFSTSATKKSWKQNICLVSLLDSVILFLRQFRHRSMFWHSFTHCREVTISNGLCRGLPAVQKYVWSYFYCGRTMEERWTQSYHLLCLTYIFLFQALKLPDAFNPYLGDTLLNSVQGSLVVGERRWMWVQETHWGRAGRCPALLLWLGPPAVTPPAWAGVALVLPGYLCRQMAVPGGRSRLPWGEWLGTGSGGWRKAGFALAVVDGVTC